ncbi:MAG: hypothetical protein HY282_13675 [Nitrospirae bacterium]|nr:hypothetical protein [Candidatus Manganitrophaceae bacterium]
MNGKATLIEWRLMSERGFTLIEVILFIIILGLAAGVLVPLTISIQGSPQPATAQRGIFLAQAELEQVIAQKRTSGFSAVATGTCSGAMPAGYTCSRTVCYVSAASLNNTAACGTATDYKRVEVTITNASIGSIKGVTLLTNS